MVPLTPAGRRGWFVAWLLLLLPFAHGTIENADAEVTLHAARAAWLRGDFGLDAGAADASLAEREVARIIAGGGSYGMTGRNGRQYVWFPIGHQLLLVPCVAVGDGLARLWPAPERAYEALHGELRGRFFWARFVASLLPIVAAAAAAALLHAIARQLGCGEADAARTMLVAFAGTQLLGEAPMTTADLPGLALLFAMAAGVLRYARGGGGAGALALAGVSGGWAVLVRYPHAIPVLLLGAWALAVAWRRRDRRGALALAAGALPELLLLVGANWLRFGDLLETGYSRGANAQTRIPLWTGVPLLLLAPGKGLLWFSPPLWLAASRRSLQALRDPAVAVTGAGLLLVLLLHGGTHYWGGGQCYGVRYLTGPAVLFLTVLLASSRPWQTQPRRWRLLMAAGLVVALGGLVTPYRGQQELALAAAGTAYPEVAPELRQDPANVDPRFSPLHSHWIYAGLSLAGRLAPDAPGSPTAAMFGVAAAGDPRPTNPEDRGFRHWWPILLGGLLGFPGWLLWLGLLLAGGVAFARRLRAGSSAGGRSADSSGGFGTPACSPPS